MACEDFTFLTEGGEIRFLTDKKYFVFFNPNTVTKEDDTKDRRETSCMMLGVRQLVKYLPAAQEAAREYNQSIAAASPETAEELKLQDSEIYSQLLSSFAGNDNSCPLKHYLLVSTYNGKSYIWLKKFFMDDNGDYKACRGGFWFSQNDDIKEFVEKCIQFCNKQRQIALEKRFYQAGGATQKGGETGENISKKIRLTRNK
jgi:hypothetical protein